MEKAELARRIAAARGYAGFKRPELAERIEMSVSSVTRWENPEMPEVPKRAVLLAIVAVTGVRRDWFDDALTLRAEPAPPPGAYEGMAPRPPGFRETNGPTSPARDVEAS